MPKTWAQKKRDIMPRFGDTPDEEDLTEAFESFVGGRTRAGQLFDLRKRAHENRPRGLDALMGRGRSEEEVFTTAAARAGYMPEEAKAALDVCLAG